MIIYKEDRFAREMAFDVDWRARALLFEVEHQAMLKRAGVRVTSVIRGSGIHTKRAIDCTFFDLTDMMPFPSVGPEIEKWLNDAADYGLGHDGEHKPIAYWHDAGTGYHLHIQVPDGDLKLKRT